MEFFSIEGLMTLGILIFLQAVLGFDNLLYLSIESKRAPAADQARVRRLGVLIAVGLRLALLALMLVLLSSLTAELVHIGWTGVLEASLRFDNLVFMLGGGFIMYTAMKEIAHMLAIQHLSADVEKKGSKSATEVLIWIVVMNLIFSFDSILSAIAITKNFWILGAAIVASGVMMLALADRVTVFITKNRMYEVLGLFILLLVGVLLLSEGAEKAHLHLFGFEVEALSKTTFYFAVAVMVLLDVAQSRYQKKLLLEKRVELQRKI